MAIGVLLIIVAIFIGIEVTALLVGQSADPFMHRRIERFLAGRPEVAEVLNLIAMQQGEDIVVAVKARMAEKTSAPALIAALNACERALRTEFSGSALAVLRAGYRKVRRSRAASGGSFRISSRG